MSGPVLLLGGGSGLATSGLLYLGSYLRRHGVEAYVRPIDTAPNLPELERRLHAVLDRVKPRVVGVSLKWFLHLHRSLFIARVVKAHDASIQVVLGGDTASHYYSELLAFDCVDGVVRGDGEAPLLAMVRGEPHPNLWSRDRPRAPLLQVGGLYAQTRDADDTFLSHLDDLFLCDQDRYLVPPFVVGGKGCSQACLYCGGARSAQAENFGRKRSFMRPAEHIRGDIRELASRAYTLAYDFSDHPLKDPTADLAAVWDGLDLSSSGILYYAWRVPPIAFVELLSRTYQSVTLALDFGCFSERHRGALVDAHLLKPLPGDAEFLEVVEECTRFPNVKVRVSGVAGLPLLEPGDLVAERRLVEKLLSYDVLEDVLFDLVHAQPGAPMLDHAERYGLWSPVRTFQDFLAWSADHAPNGEYVPPLFQRGVASGNGGAASDAAPPGHDVVTAHRELAETVAGTLERRARDGALFADFANIEKRRFRRAPKARVLHRYSLRTWLPDFERQGVPDALLDEEQARITFGHLWDEGMGAVTVPATVVDHVLPQFEVGATGGEALSRIRARGVGIEPDALASIVRFFYERGIMDVSDG